MENPKRKPLFKKKKAIAVYVVAFLIIALIGIRAYLPVWVTNYVNQKISELDGYGGSVKDIDLSLWRGAYQIHGLDIYKTGGGLKEPFVAAGTIDLSIQWRALFDGAIVAEADIYKADLNFAKSQTGEGAGWTEFIDSLSPFDINRIAVHSGKVAYKDYAATPNVNLYIKDINALVTNIRNTEEKEVALPSDVKITGNSIGSGKLDISGKINVLKETPDFDMALKLENADLTAFNDYSNEFLSVDFQSGTFDIFGELAAAKGYATGYVKPIAIDVSLVDVGNQDTNPFNIIWESVVSVFIEVFENQSQDQFAMRIPIEGSLDKPDQDLWSAFISIFQNAFAGAFSRDEDGTIDFNDALIEK